jgi:hypothetical protein
MIDSCTDGDDLATACRNVGITASPPCADGGLAAGAAVPETAARLAAVAAERALVIALACARKSGLYAWDGTMDTTRIMDVTAWDLFPDTARAGVPYEQTVS